MWWAGDESGGRGSSGGSGVGVVMGVVGWG